MSDIVSCLRLLCGSRFISLDDALVLDQNALPHQFAEHYRVHLYPRIKIYEEKRLNALKNLRTRLWLSVPAAIVYIIIGWICITNSYIKNWSDCIEIIGGWSVVLFMALAAFVWQPVKTYHNTIKEDIFPLILNYFGAGFQYTSHSQMPITLLHASEIIPQFDREESEDYVRGNYKGVALESVETELIRQENSRSRKDETTVFKGLFIRLQANKKFHGRTIIRTEADFLSNWWYQTNRNLEPVTLEDPEFESRFNVYADDQVESRYLLTTSFMQRLLNLQQIFAQAPLQASFYNNTLLLMLPYNRPWFEPASIFQPATFIDEVNMLFNCMHELFAIIDTLKLDEQTGL